MVRPARKDYCSQRESNCCERPRNLLVIAFVPEDRGEMLFDTSTPGIEYTTVLNLAQTYVGYQ
jgi:hypothetical protein